MLRRIGGIVLIIVLAAGQIAPARAYTLVPDYLCKIAIRYYHQGYVELALEEFRKALIANPDNEIAKEYIERITQESLTVAAPEPSAAVTIARQQQKAAGVPAPSVVPLPKSLAKPVSREQSMAAMLDNLEQARPVQKQQPRPQPDAVPAEPSVALRKASLDSEEAVPALPVAKIRLGQDLSKLASPIELEKANTLTIAGHAITRFLMTQADIIEVKQLNGDEVQVSAGNLGYTYLHIWDASGRSTLEFLVTPQRPKGPTLEEAMRKDEEISRNFKFRYSVDWQEFMTGRRLNELDRQYYTYTHTLSLTGDTPYGIFDSTAMVSAENGTTEVTHLTFGLEHGLWNSFRDFSIRVFDFDAKNLNLAFAGEALQGGQFTSPAFHDTIDYELFWGKERQNSVIGIGSGLSDTIDAYIGGATLNWHPSRRQKYSLSAYQGGGSEREDELYQNAYDVNASLSLGRWDFFHETAFDTKHFANVSSVGVKSNRFEWTEEFRDISQNYMNMSGLGWRAGEIGSLTSLMVRPTDKIDLNAQIDVFKDRLYPSENRGDVINEDVFADANYYFSPRSRLRADFAFQNEIGRLSELRAYNTGIGLYRTFEFLSHKFNTYQVYRFQNNRYFNSPTLSYYNNKLSLGIRFNLIGELYYFLNREYNWTISTFDDSRATPELTETGLEWFNQIGNSPFWGDLRLTYHDEQDAESPFSFLSGEDYLECYGELTYRPNSQTETYISSRYRNVWAENDTAQKRMELTLNAGMRYLWDTGVRWEAVGMIEGVVFKDYNLDGIWQADEPLVPDIRIHIGKKREKTTNAQGYYLFSHIRARKVFVSIDTSSLPGNFVLTTPATQEVLIQQSVINRIDFGIASNTEISGWVFDDVDKDGKISTQDKPVRGVVIALEDGTTVKTDAAGRYAFRKAAPGQHRVTLDLKTLPAQYLPLVRIYQDVDLQEGTSFVYNFPLEKSASEEE